jgi:plasmid replication DNA-binding protein KfrA
MDYDKVVSAIDALRAQGQRPTLRAVHDLVGGSMRDLHPLWKAVVGDSDSPEDGDEPDPGLNLAGAEDDARRPEWVAPDDAIAAAERAVVEAELAVKLKLDALPPAEGEFNDSRARLIEALAAQVGVLEGHRRGLFAGDDHVRADVEDEVQDAAAHYRDARQRWRLAMQAVEGFTARRREAEQRLRQAKRERYLQTAHAELWAELQDAIAARANDPRLDTRHGVDVLQERRAQWYHQDKITTLQRQCEAACEAAGL